MFLKEHSRGLYSVSSHFAVNSWPLYLLRALNAVIYTCFFVKGLVIDDSTSKLAASKTTLSLFLINKLFNYTCGCHN